MIADQENSNVKFLRSTVGLNPHESAFIHGKKPLLFSVPPVVDLAFYSRMVSKGSHL
jgi:hypothetical protein